MVKRKGKGYRNGVMGGKGSGRKGLLDSKGRGRGREGGERRGEGIGFTSCMGKSAFLSVASCFVLS